MNFYRKYPGDYARDTAHLSYAEHGVYNLLLDHCFATEKPLPKELADIYRICRAMTAADRRVVQSVAKQFFPLTKDGRENPRAARQIPLEQERIRIAKENGRRGGRPPKAYPSGFIRNNPVGSQKEPSGLAKITQRGNLPTPTPTVKEKDYVQEEGSLVGTSKGVAIGR